MSIPTTQAAAPWSRPAPKRSESRERAFDSCLKTLLPETDVVVMKIDVEGSERQVLEGAAELLRTTEAHVMVEDFVDDSIIDYLTSVGASFQAKLTPYNSWWRL